MNNIIEEFLQQPITSMLSILVYGVGIFIGAIIVESAKVVFQHIKTNKKMKRR